ncbi:MAG: anthranilate phosphoribosyltransferase [Planctomycetaceae bacterium]
MTNPITDAIHAAVDRRDLTVEQMRAAVGAVMDGNASEAETAALLTALRMKGEAVDEIVGAARAMVERCTPVRCSRSGLLDTCGTGGDALHTFNISTATALVVAATGVPIAKHGNRSVSSTSGSADVLKALGVNIELSAEQVGACIDELGIGFCFAPLFHGAMKHAAAVRRQLGFRTIFNLLGPLTNPAGAPFQLLGANTPNAAEKIARTLQRLGRKRAVVVCGNRELDEVALWGETTAWIIEAGNLRTETWTPASFGLPSCAVEELVVSSADESARVIRGVIAGEAGPARNIVLANCAAALFAVDETADLPTGVATAENVLDDGSAGSLLDRFVTHTRSALPERL